MRAEQDGVGSGVGGRCGLDGCCGVSACLRTLPPPYWEHHKPPNVTPSGSVEKQGREDASAGSCLWGFICSQSGGGDLCLKPDK